MRMLTHTFLLVALAVPQAVFVPGAHAGAACYGTCMATCVGGPVLPVIMAAGPAGAAVGSGGCAAYCAALCFPAFAAPPACFSNATRIVDGAGAVVPLPAPGAPPTVADGGRLNVSAVPGAVEFRAFTLASGARVEVTPEHVVIVGGPHAAAGAPAPEPAGDGDDGGEWRIDLAARVRVGDRMLTGGAADAVVAVDRVHGDVRYTVASASGTVEVLGAGGVDGSTVLVGAMCTGEAFEPKPYPAALRDWQRRHPTTP